MELKADSVEMDRYFPFRRLGFRCNPFRALTPDEMSMLAVIPDDVRRAFYESQEHLQIIGAAGRGKTTSLLGLSSIVLHKKMMRSYEYIPAESQTYKSDTAKMDVFLLDEAQRLDKRSFSRLVSAAKQGVRIILSSHEDLTHRFVSQDLVLRNMHVAALSHNQVNEIFSRRLQFFSFDGRPGVTLTAQAIEVLQSTYGTDIRAMLDVLYEVFQDRTEKGALTALDLQRVDGP